MKKCRCLVAVSHNNFKTGADGHLIFLYKACRALNVACPQEMPWGKSSEKNSKQGRLPKSQLQEENFIHTV